MKTKKVVLKDLHPEKLNALGGQFKGKVYPAAFDISDYDQVAAPATL